MAEMETLDTLLGPGPSADGNPDASAGQTGPGSSDASQGASTGDASEVTARLADLESKLQRNVERLQGAESSALEWKTRAEQLEQTTQTLATRLESLSTTPPVAATDAIPPTFLTTLTNNLGYEPSLTEAQALWNAAKHALPRPDPAPTTQTTTDYLTKQDLEAYTSRQTTQQQAIQAMIGQHPELADAGFVQTVIQEYDALKQDPMTSVLYPEAQDGPTVVNMYGRNFDLRLIDKATTQLKARAGTAQDAHDNPTLEGGRTVTNGTKPTSPAVPTAFVKEGGIFSDPTVTRALQLAGKGGNTRQQIEWMLSKMSPTQRAEWDAQMSRG